MREHHEHERMLHGTTNSKWWGGQACLLCCLLFFAPLVAVAQNLVPNPSFEEADTCTYTIGFQESSKPLHWEKWLWSPEYFSTCAGALNGIDTLLGVPLNGLGFQYPWEGDSYVGMHAYSQDFREYVGCELVAPLQIGASYELSFWANMATDGTYWNVDWACNNLGLLFTMHPNVWSGLSGPPFPFRNYAHLHATEVIADTANWTLVQGVFTADSAYRYLVIGNFFEDALTDTLHVNGVNSLGAYYFVDGICVKPVGGECEAPVAVAQHQPAAPRCWPNPAQGQLWIEGADEGFQIYDCMGRQVLEVQGTGQRVCEVEVMSWPIGTYFIRLLGSSSFVHAFVVM